MEAPGMSMFQGSPSLHLNNSAQERLQEQEEIDDKKRREAELRIKLDGAFDDLDEGEEEGASQNSDTMNASNEDAVGLSRQIHECSSGQQLAPVSEAKRCNGIEMKARKPPSYVESLHHINHSQHNGTQRLDDKNKYSIRGGGDSQENEIYYHTDFRSNLNGFKTSMEAKQELINHESLKAMLDMRVKECEQLAQELQEFKTKADKETDTLRKRLDEAIKEREKSQFSHQQAQHLISQGQHRIFELEQQLCEMKNKLVTTEEETKGLQLALTVAETKYHDVQQRLSTFKVQCSHDTDALFKEQQDRHRAELDRFQESLEKARNRIEEKDNEIKILERRCKEIEHSKEELLVEKSAMLRKVAAELEKAQSQLASGDSARLREKVALLTSDRNMAREQVKELGSKLEATAQELARCRKQLAGAQEEYDKFRRSLHQMVQDSAAELAYLSSPSSAAPVSLLPNIKDILHKYKQQSQKLATLQEDCLEKDKNLKVLRERVSHLQSEIKAHKSTEMQLHSKVAILEKRLDVASVSGGAELLDTYKEQNRQLELQMDALRDDYKKLEKRHSELESKQEQARSQAHGAAERKANEDLRKELERLAHQLKETAKENCELKTLYFKVSSTKDACNRELQDVKLKLEYLQHEKDSIAARERECTELLEREREQMQALKQELESEREELIIANKRISELQKEFKDKHKDFTDKLNEYIKEETSSVRKSIGQCVQCEILQRTIRQMESQIHEYTVKIDRYESNTALMQDLKDKGEFFQKYIMDRFQRLQNQMSASTQTEGCEPLSAQYNGTADNEDRLCDNRERLCDNEVDNSFTFRTELLKKEKQIREEIAVMYSLEIKTIELNCSKRIKEVENEHANKLDRFRQILEGKTEEIENLKKFVISERSKMADILKTKQQEMNLLLKQKQHLVEEYETFRVKVSELKSQLEQAQAKNAKLKSKQEKRSSESASERERLNRCVADVTQRLRAAEEKSEELEAQYDLLKDKYKNVKKTALVYKEYASKKDEHVEGELARIRAHYEAAVARLQDKLRARTRHTQLGSRFEVDSSD